MPYANAEQLLPPELVAELQKYAAGEVLYIPRLPDTHRPWGMVNGTRQRLRARNAEIQALKAQGHTIEALAEQYCLSPDGIRKVLYRRKHRPATPP